MSIENSSPDKYYDLSERGSERNDEEGTRIARQEDADTLNEDTNTSRMSSEKGDSAGENKVATSIDDE